MTEDRLYRGAALVGAALLLWSGYMLSQMM